MINKLEIKRDAIEKFLMRIKDSIKKHKKAAIAVVCTIVLLCAAADALRPAAERARADGSAAEMVERAGLSCCVCRAIARVYGLLFVSLPRQRDGRHAHAAWAG